MTERYILNANREPIPCPSLLMWAEWYRTADRQVARTQVGALLVSTVFLGLDHNWSGGEPILFETMIFGPSDFSGIDQFRYRTWREAETAHAKIVDELKAAQTNMQLALNPPPKGDNAS